MAVKTPKGISVAIERLPGDGKDEILKIGTDVWNALVPTFIREGPIAVSVSLLQSHAEIGKRLTSLLSSVVCSAVPSKDVQVSDRLLFAYTAPDSELPSLLHSASLQISKSNTLVYFYPPLNLAMLERRTLFR
jgi:hypothetical protein